MLHDLRLGVEFFAWLTEEDRKIARGVASRGCGYCGGPLHQGNYDRKPRGGSVAVAAEIWALRYSLCCGGEGCRRRTLPPSLRFLGRRVYVEAVVLVASVVALLLGAVKAGSNAVLVPMRTLKRWGVWWTEAFPQSVRGKSYGRGSFQALSSGCYRGHFTSGSTRSCREAVVRVRLKRMHASRAMVGALHNAIVSGCVAIREGILRELMPQRVAQKMA